MATDYTKWVQLGLTRWDAYIPRKKPTMELLFQIVVSVGLVSLWLFLSMAWIAMLCVLWS